MLDFFLDKWIRSEAGKRWLSSFIRRGLQTGAALVFANYLEKRGVNKDILISWSGVTEALAPAIVAILVEVWTVVRARTTERQLKVATTAEPGTPIVEVKQMERELRAKGEKP